jgi:hypothetical protein
MTRRGNHWSKMVLVLGGLVIGLSGRNLPGPVASARWFPFDGRVQEGEVSLKDGDEAVVRYKTVYQAPPHLVLVEFKQSWFKDRPYSKSDFQIVQQDATGFKIMNNHPEAAVGASATIRWRAEGVPAAEQPAPPQPLQALAPNSKPTPEQLVAAIKALGGSVNVQPVFTIDLHHTHVSDANLETLQAFPTLRVLNLAGTGVSDAGLRPVGALTQLQILYLNNTAISDAGLAQLGGLKELRELSLYHTRVTDEGLSQLKTLANLRDLTLSGPHITDRGLMQLSGLRNLRHLNLSQTGVSKEGLLEMKKALPKIEIIQ